MDFKFLGKVITGTILLMIIVFGVVLYQNGYIFSEWNKQSKVESSAPLATGEVTAGTTQELEGLPKGQLTADLSAWMQDETFFNADNILQSSLQGDTDKQLSLIATSVEKDLRVQIVNGEGLPVKGQSFLITVAGSGEYKDLDQDGIIYVGNMKAGEYQVALQEQEGYAVDTTSVKVTVKNQVEYKEIADISLLIKTEDEVDASKEDTEDKGAIKDADDTKTDEILERADAIFGIDVSKWNHEIDWEKVSAENVKYAIVRCGYRGSSTGSLVEDPNFKMNMEGAADAGIKTGVYFFTQAVTEVEAVEEASMVIALCQNYQISYPIFIDTEGAGGNGRADSLGTSERSKICQAFCETIRSAGYQAGIYASKNWYQNNLDITKFSGDNVIWLAEYREQPSYGGVYQLWQYTSGGRINGIEGSVDLNLSFMDYE